MRKETIGGAVLYLGDCIDVMRTMPDNSVDSIVTDPPYELGFMGKGWDKSGIANSVEMWLEALRVLKPGGHLLAFSGSRTYHRMTCAIEDAGFEIRDQIMWLYGSGFPKSLDVSKAIDKAAGAEREVVGSKIGLPGYSLATSKGANVYEGAFGGCGDPVKESEITAPATEAARQWQGWGTALKPAHEPVCVARKPFKGTVAANVLEHGTGALNIDGCRVGTSKDVPASASRSSQWFGGNGETGGESGHNPNIGRWPANVIHDGSDEVVGLFPVSKWSASPRTNSGKGNNCYGDYQTVTTQNPTWGDQGSAARFFYCAKASRRDRGEGNTHPTVKPTDLMRYLCRLVTPPNGVVLDPFMGSGSTGKAAMIEGFRFIGIDMTPEYIEIARARITAAVPANDNVKQEELF